MSNLEISREGGPSVARNALVSGPMRINAVAQKKKSLAPKISTLMGRRSGRQVRTARADDPRKAGGKAPMTAVRCFPIRDRRDRALLKECLWLAPFPCPQHP